jgi:uncharacterized protein
MPNKINRYNKLSEEKSPYLLQHSQNPVDWYPWGNEAFSKASKEDKPVFLSIGYSTCHWCHVMEKESFEDEEVALLLNDAFVCVKVDREERPDIDNIYMSACTMITGSGGWPLTIIMTPDKKPFFAATYIPKHSKWSRPGLLELIPKIKEIWTGSRNEIEHSAGEITSSITRNIAEKTEKPGPDIFRKAYSEFAANFDSVNGGFGDAPKFPSPQNILYLLRYWKQFKNEDALKMAVTTLKKMRAGGIFDQIGFGFHRYSTDAQWLVPHFEKMLYDQAMLAMVYAEAYQATGDNFYKTTCDEIISYVQRDMTSPEGGFYSAEDADSEGVEGKFYFWEFDELSGILSDDELNTAVKVFNIKKEGNFKEDAGQENTGLNILHITESIEKNTEESDIAVDELRMSVEKICKKLFSARGKRIRPLKDNKILTDWNGLMIAALALAGRIFDNKVYIDSAIKAVDFIRSNLLRKDNRLLHRYRDGDAAIVANLDDYAFLCWGLSELYQATLNAEYLKSAIELTEVMISHFADETTGVFYFSPDDGEEQITRVIVRYDGAIPSGNSVAFYNLLRLGRLTGNTKLEEHAEKIAGHASSGISRIPSGHAMFLIGLNYAKGDSCDVVIAGNLNDPEVKQMISAVNKFYLPDLSVIFNPVEAHNPIITDIAPFVKSQTAIAGKATAYVCRGNTCSLPVHNVTGLIAMLQDQDR